ncbi:MAG: hypothetical protein HY296_02670 [Thaumarchaeota archaeon]|nr:hypothetical protein [Nitrososphaerota archaeon]
MTPSSNGTGTLNISGMASGLGNSVTTATASTTSVTATWQCVNHGGNQPGPKTTTTGPAFASVPVTAHNGQVTFSVTLSAGSAPSAAGFCSASGRGWSVVLVSAVYASATVSLLDSFSVTILSTTITGPWTAT